MKRNILYLSLAAALASTSLTGCIDNDEPDGIIALRQAKASYINAQAANETTLANANAAYKAAETALKNAEAKQAEALAKQAEYEAAKVEYEAKLAEAKTEAEIAAVKAELEVTLQQKANALQQAKAEAEQLAQEAATELNNLKAAYNQSLATLEASSSSYAEALKQIKASETVLDTKSGSYITVAQVYQKYLNAKNTYRSATEDVAVASADYVEALSEFEVNANKVANRLADDLKDAQLKQQAAEKALEVKKTALEAAQNKGLMTEAEFTEKVNELDAQISALDVKIAENMVAQAKFAVVPEQQKVELQSQIDELNKQLETSTNSAGETIYPNSESLDAIQAKINEATAEIESLSKDYNDSVQAIEDERSYWSKIILTWEPLAVSNYSEIEGVFSDSFRNSSIFEMDGNGNIVVKQGYEKYFTNSSLVSNYNWGGYYYYDQQDKELDKSVSFLVYQSYAYSAGSFSALYETVKSACAAYVDLGVKTSDSKIYKAFSDVKTALEDKYYTAAKETYDKFAEKLTALETAYNTTTANQVLDIEKVTIPALQKELAAAEKVITDQINTLIDQKNAIVTVDSELAKELALLQAEINALADVMDIYKYNYEYNSDAYIQGLEEDVADAEADLEDAKVAVTNAQYLIDQFNSQVESSDFNAYNYQLQLKKVALDNAKEDLQKAQEELEYYDALFKSSVEALSSSAE